MKMHTQQQNGVKRGQDGSSGSFLPFPVSPFQLSPPVSRRCRVRSHLNQSQNFISSRQFHLARRLSKSEAKDTISPRGFFFSFRLLPLSKIRVSTVAIIFQVRTTCSPGAHLYSVRSTYGEYSVPLRHATRGSGYFSINNHPHQAGDQPVQCPVSSVHSFSIFSFLFRRRQTLFSLMLKIQPREMITSRNPSCPALGCLSTVGPSLE